jgi:transcriptional regulator with XRE-family HTH domain
MQQMVSFGAWMRQRRRALDLTQAELAHRVGCATGTIKKFEGDARRPSREIAALLATHLQIAPEQREDFIRCARAELTPDRLPSPSPSVPRAAFVPVGSSPAQTQEARRAKLPAQPTPLIGRERELVQVTALLARPGVRLVTLTGPGGTGKTRLAIRAAELAFTSQPPIPSRRGRGVEGEGQPFPDGAFFVDLAPLAAADQVLPTIAQVLGVKELVGTTLQERVREYLQPRQLLLLHDNFEHLLPAASLVADLLRAAPQLSVLVTSRVVLRLSGEHEYAVPPLRVPDPRHMPPPERLSQYEAVRLFIERAQAVRAGCCCTPAR